MSLLTNLIGYWNFDENTGTTAADASGNGLTLTLTSASWTPGKINSAFNPAGSVTATDTAAVLNAGDVTVAGWIKRASTGVVGVFVSNRWFFIWVRASNALALSSDAQTTSVAGASIADTTTWHHIVATRTSGGTGQIWLDGVSSASGATGTPQASATADKFGVAGTGGQNFNGAMDEWGFWSRILTSGEIATLYNSGAGLSYPLGTSTGPQGGVAGYLSRVKKLKTYGYYDTGEQVSKSRERLAGIKNDDDEMALILILHELL